MEPGEAALREILRDGQRLKLRELVVRYQQIRGLEHAGDLGDVAARMMERGLLLRRRGLWELVDEEDAAETKRESRRTPRLVGSKVPEPLGVALDRDESSCRVWVRCSSETCPALASSKLWSMQMPCGEQRDTVSVYSAGAAEVLLRIEGMTARQIAGTISALARRGALCQTCSARQWKLDHAPPPPPLPTALPGYLVGMIRINSLSFDNLAREQLALMKDVRPDAFVRNMQLVFELLHEREPRTPAERAQQVARLGAFVLFAEKHGAPRLTLDPQLLGRSPRRIKTPTTPKPPIY